MTEIIINYPSKAALVQMATVLGYYDAASKAIVAQAQIDAGGEYFFNNVGQVVDTPAVYDSSHSLVSPAVLAPGLWARLRHNADSAALADKIASSRAAAISLGIVVYQRAQISGQTVWTSDGVTPGPAYLDQVGVIA
jgi:hypothetical protein